MKKLNKNGWGTMEMLLLSGGLLLALIVAIFLISQLYKNSGLNFNGNIYKDLESNLELAAEKFVNNNEIDIYGEYRISYATLKANDLIKDFVDENGNECNGYVIANNNDNVVQYKAYITCNNYETK